MKLSELSEMTIGGLISSIIIEFGVETKINILLKMAITNRQQALAQELIEELGDKKLKAFGMYMRLIKKHGEGRVRAILSEVKHDYHTGKIGNPAKVFMYRLKNNQ